jgi:hypothetical protein
MRNSAGKELLDRRLDMTRATRVIAGPAAALRAPVFVVDDFLRAELAVAMREDINAHFAEPAAHRPDTHQVWNY